MCHNNKYGLPGVVKGEKYSHTNNLKCKDLFSTTRLSVEIYRTDVNTLMCYKSNNTFTH